jgi:HlyD family secretion protein
MAKADLSQHLESLKIDHSSRHDDGPSVPRWIWAGIVLLIVAGVGWAAANAFRSPAVETARVVSIETREQSSVLVASGYVVAHHKISLGSKVMGKVAWIGVEKGDIVKKDQLLVRLEDAEYKAQVLQAQGNLSAAQAHYEEMKNGSRPEEIARAKSQAAQAEAAMRLAKTQLDRNIGLAKDGVVSKSDLDNAQATYDNAKANWDATVKTYELARIGNRAEDIETARAQVDQARGQLDYAVTLLVATEIRSPVNGTVLNRLVETGEMVTTSFVGDQGAKSSVVSLADLDDLLVELDINQNDFARVQSKQTATVVADAYQDRKYQGIVFEISPEANRQKGTVQVKVKVLNPDGLLRPEMNAKVSFHGDKAAEVKNIELMVPKSAVFQSEGKPAVAVVDNGRATFKSITVGDTTGESVHVAAGLSGNETVVVGNPGALQNGQRVRTK